MMRALICVGRFALTPSPMLAVALLVATGCGSSSSEGISRTNSDAGPSGSGTEPSGSDTEQRLEDASAAHSADAATEEAPPQNPERDASLPADGEAQGDASAPPARPASDAAMSGEAATDPDQGDLGSPCNVAAEQGACGDGLCFGTPSSGYFCRPPCEAAQNAGDACGQGGMCLENRAPGQTGDGQLGCVEGDDCDPLTGEGCEPTESCAVVRLEPLLTQCVPEGSGQPWDSCDAAVGNPCARGATCLGSDLEDDEPGRCTPHCFPGAPLPSDCELCVEQIAGLGTCAQCAVLDDACPDGSQCHPVNEALGGVCVEFGPGAPGDPCGMSAQTSCEASVLCMEEELEGPDAMRCVQTCDSLAPQCDAVAGRTTNCFDVALLEPAFGFGELGLCSEELPGPICVPEEGVDCVDGACILLDSTEQGTAFGYCLPSCDPTLADCGENYACLPFSEGEVNAEPFLQGNGLCGTGCEADDDCGDGSCLLLDGLEAPGVCGSSCDPDLATETCDGQCVAVGAGVGLCIPALSMCGARGECAYGSCSYLSENDDTGVCLLPCLVQDSSACAIGEQVLGECLLRDDPTLHDGVCLGQDNACDPVAQSGCTEGQVCQVTGGAAFGGGAILCAEPGPSSLDAECDGNDDCAEGLLCAPGQVPRTCRPFCDAAAPNCASGACTDVSESFYLPEASVAACMSL